jgi:hypothetical protein
MFYNIGPRGSPAVEFAEEDSADDRFDVEDPVESKVDEAESKENPLVSML